MSNFRRSMAGPGPAGGAVGGGAGMSGPTRTGIPRPISGQGNNNNNNSNNNGMNNSRNAGGGGANPETFNFPSSLVLKAQSIVSCMADVQVPFSVEDLQRPNPQKMSLVYETFMDVAVGSAKEDCYLEDIQEMDVVSHPELVVDAVRFYIFLEQLVNMMQKVGVNDFSSRDLTKPEAERVRRILSAIINFAKFREDRQGSFFQEMRKTDDLVELIGRSEQDQMDMMQELDQIKQTRDAEAPKVEEYKLTNQKLASELEELKRKEHAVTQHKDEVTAERLELKDLEKELGAAVRQKTEELNALQARRVDVPENLEEELRELPGRIQALADQVVQLQRTVQERTAALKRIEAVSQQLEEVLPLMRNMVEMLEELERKTREKAAVLDEIDTAVLVKASNKAKMEQVLRKTAKVEENLKKFEETKVAKRETGDKEVEAVDAEFDRVQAIMLKNKMAMEEKRKRHQELVMEAEKFSRAVTLGMEENKRLFEACSSKMLTILRS